MTKLRVGVCVLTAALIVTMVGSSLSDAGPHRRAGGAPHQLSYEAGAMTVAALVRAGRTRPDPVTDAAQAAGWSTVRAVLAGNLEAVRLAAARRAAARRAAARRAAWRRSHPGTTRLCRRYQHVAISGPGGADLVVRNDDYGGRGECLANKNRWANFAVTVSVVHRTARARRFGRGEPVAFPNIFYGCSWGICSPGSKLPRRLSRLRNPVTSWYTVGRASGQWDAAYDIWFAKTRRTNGQAHGAEVMLWLRAKGFGAPSAAHSLLIDHRRWELEHWITTNPVTGGHWPLIIFRMVNQRGYVRHLALMPFFRRLEAMGLLNRSWWLTAIEAGFEVWRGGTGLRTTLFWVHP